jgi:hypothetical protein
MVSLNQRLRIIFVGRSIPFFSHYFGSFLSNPRRQIPLRSEDDGAKAFRRIKQDRGVVIAWLVAVCFGSSSIRLMDRVERSVLPADGGDPMAFRASFLVDLQMLSVTGALIAQVTITALSLANLNEVHWIAKAAFVVSLVFAGLSVWTSTTGARLLNGRDDPTILRDWLSVPAPRSARSQFDKIFKSRLKTTNLSSQEEVSALRAEITRFLEDHRWKTASFYTCALLSAPSQLLNYSLASLLVGLGVYLGKIWRNKLDPVAGNMASRAVFACYITATLYGLALFFGVSTGNYGETGIIQRWIAALETVDGRAQAEPRRADVEAGKASAEERNAS